MINGGNGWQNAQAVSCCPPAPPPPPLAPPQSDLVVGNVDSVESFDSAHFTPLNGNFPHPQQQQQQQHQVVPSLPFHQQPPQMMYTAMFGGANPAAAAAAANDDAYANCQSWNVRGMDSLLDDFDPYTRERCHTWPRQQRPEEADLYSRQNSTHLAFSPPSLPSHGSSGLSLITESNESLTVVGTGTDDNSLTGCDTDRRLSMQQLHHHSASGGSANAVGQQQQQGSAYASPNKRQTATVPNYKAGHPSYVELITQAIASSPEKRMTLSEIYDWMVANVSSFKDQRHLHSSAGWKNSVRHNLSLHGRFKRVKRNGMDKPSWWTVDLSEETKRERNKRPKQSRPRSNTTTATSVREYQQQRQSAAQLRNTAIRHNSCSAAPIQKPPQQQQPSQQQQPQRPQQNGAMCGSQFATPASSMNGMLYNGTDSISGKTQPYMESSLGEQMGGQQRPLIDYFGPRDLDDDPFNVDSRDCMDWSMHAMSGRQPGDEHKLLGESTSISTLEPVNEDLRCLSQAITVSLRDSPNDGVKPDIALCVNGNGPMMYEEQHGMLGKEMNGKGSCQSVRVQTGNGQVQEVLVPSPMPIRVVIRSDKSCQTDDRCSGDLEATLASYLQICTPPPPSACVVQQHTQQHTPQQLQQSQQLQQPMQQTKLELEHESQTTTLINGYNQYTTMQNSYTLTQNGIVSPLELSCQTNSRPYADSGPGKVMPCTPVNLLPEDLASLDVNESFDCNILDVLSYEMNCNIPKFA